MRRGRVVSSSLRMTLCSDQQGWRRACEGWLGGLLSIGWRWVSGISLGLKDSSGSVVDADEILEEWLVRPLSWLLEHVPSVALASALGFLGLASRNIRRRKSSATSCETRFSICS